MVEFKDGERECNKKKKKNLVEDTVTQDLLNTNEQAQNLLLVVNWNTLYLKWVDKQLFCIVFIREDNHFFLAKIVLICDP